MTIMMKNMKAMRTSVEVQYCQVQIIIVGRKCNNLNAFIAIVSFNTQDMVPTTEKRK